MSVTQRMPFFNTLQARLATPTFILACLLGITLAGSFLRLYQLGEWSFWGDEMFTVSGLEDGFNYTPLRQSLSTALIQTFTNTYGITEWNARLIPAFIGISSLPILFLIARAFFDTPTALLSTLLLALSPWHVYWSQNARFYTALLLFYTLALFFFHKGMEEDKPAYLVICLAFLGLAVKERLLALFFLPVVALYLLALWVFSFKKPNGWNTRNLLLFVVPGAIGGLLFAAPYLQNFSGWMDGFGYVNNNPIWLAGGFVFYVGTPVLCIGALGATHLLAQKDRLGLLLTFSAVIPILSLVMIAPFHYTASRYAFTSLTSWLLLAAVSAVSLIRSSTSNPKLLAYGSLIILLVAPLTDNLLYFTRQNGNRDDWRSAFQYVSAQWQDGDSLYSGDTYISKYYLGTDTPYYGDWDYTAPPITTGRVWFVEDLETAQKFPEIHGWVLENAQLISIHDVVLQSRTIVMRVYLYEPMVEK